MKPLKRFPFALHTHTSLKRGVNESHLGPVTLLKRGVSESFLSSCCLVSYCLV